MLKFEVVTPNVIRLQINNMISVIYPVNIVFGQLFFLLLSAVWILGRNPGTPPADASLAYVPDSCPQSNVWRLEAANSSIVPGIMRVVICVFIFIQLKLKNRKFGVAACRGATMSEWQNVLVPNCGSAKMSCCQNVVVSKK